MHLLRTLCFGVVAVAATIQGEGGEQERRANLYASHQIQAILDSISASNIRSYLDTLVGFYYRHTMDDTLSPTTGMGAARRWVYRKFQEFSAASGGRLQPQYFDFTATICGITRLHRNIMAILPGTVTPDRYFIVSGHIDTRGDPNNACAYEIFSPGANDDGSGTAVSIELARVLSRYQFDASLIFMAVTGEDEGLFGSAAYAAFAQSSGMRIDGMITNDVVGNIVGSGGIIDSLSVRHFSSVSDLTPHRQMARYMKLKAEYYYPIMTVNLIPDVDRPGRSGDHVSFQNRGYTAVRFVEPNENLANQHTPTDIVENMSPAYTARVARVNAAGLASLAWAPEKPAPPTLADPGNGTSLLVTWLPTTPVPDLAGYRLAVRDSGALYFSRVLDAGNVLQYTITGLTPGVKVAVSVSAYDTAGNESLFSQEALATPSVAPAAPTNVTSTSYPTNVVITWTASPQLDVLRYRIYRSTMRRAGFAVYDSVASPATTYVDGGLPLHQLFFYHVRAVDSDGNESPASAVVAGQRVSHDGGILVVDGTRDGTGGPTSPTDGAVDSAYQSLLAGFNVAAEWDVADSAAENIRISDAELGRYSTVVWHTDVRGSSPLYQDTTALRKFLQQGGRLLISGWKLSGSLNASIGATVTYPPGSFVPLYLKMDSTLVSGVLSQDFKTAQAAFTGYADVTVDSVKIPVYNGALVNTDAVLLPYAGPNVQTLFTHRGRVPGSPLEGRPVGWRYLGSDFKVVVFDFPLYFMRENEARAAVTRALLDLGELPLSVASGTIAPLEFVLEQNYPNPFNPATRIPFSVRGPGQAGFEESGSRFMVQGSRLVTLKVYDVLGREVATLVNEQLQPGRYEVTFDASALGSGVYFYQMKAGSFVATRKLVILR